ncbi:uncharacterized protein LOC126315312 [Schistocerca gregaria]|uniref:uncharacterized protein LOC126315312 n=1 Tax=Schistocerca gregaria TaxID=7010 RepID=UPI00211DA6E2|nr:uncharacterized protein LOC126315312 [Schistocerca gregaria]
MGANESSLEPNAFEVPGTGIEGIETPTWRNMRCLKLNNGELTSSYFLGIDTCHEMFIHLVKKYSKNRCIGVRDIKEDSDEYVWLDYETVLQKVKCVGSGLRGMGLETNAKIAIYTKNRLEWILVIQACYAQSYVSVPTYETLDDKKVLQILREAEVECLFCGQDKIERLQANCGEVPRLRYIVAFDYVRDGGVKGGLPGIEVLSFKELLERGQNDPVPFTPPSRTDIATICYTTANSVSQSRGCLLTHGNLLAGISACLYSGIQLTEADVYLSYLPLAHMYQRLFVEACLMAGAAVGFYAGDISTLFDEVARLKPTIFSSVPRVFNKFHKRIVQVVESFGEFYKMVFDAVLQVKRDSIRKRRTLRSYVWDRLIFYFIRNLVGGRVRLVISGSTPLSSKLQDFMRVSLSCPLVQGYGLTETTGMCTLQTVEDLSVDNVGPPLTCCEVKLVSIPELGYSVADVPPRGEICVRGFNVFDGYLNGEKGRLSRVDGDNWFHTGDIGSIGEDGNLVVLDGKRNFVRVKEKGFVSFEKLEAVLSKSKCVSQIFVYGECDQPALVAVVVLEVSEMRDWIGEGGAVDELCRDERVRKRVLEDMVEVGIEHGLADYELVRDVYLESVPFTIESGELSRKHKLKRMNLKNKYADVIVSMFRRCGEREAAEVKSEDFEGFCSEEKEGTVLGSGGELVEKGGRHVVECRGVGDGEARNERGVESVLLDAGFDELSLNVEERSPASEDLSETVPNGSSSTEEKSGGLSLTNKSSSLDELPSNGNLLSVVEVADSSIFVVKEVRGKPVKQFGCLLPQKEPLVEENNIKMSECFPVIF